MKKCLLTGTAGIALKPKTNDSTAIVDPRLAEIGTCLYRVSVKAVIINERREILCVQEDREMWWGLPGGGLEYGENYIDALRRELTEELSVPSSQITIEPDIIMFANEEVYAHLPRVQFYVRCHLHTSDIKAADDIQAIGWFTAEQLSGLKLSTSMPPIMPQLLTYLQKV